MRDLAMDAPYIIASLPSPLDKEQGRIYTAPVHALKGSKKRKRHEVAAAVDGEGISIYNVQTQALVTSYAVPPQTYFCSSPCSIFCRATADEPATRRTYIAAKDGTKSKTQRLLCFVEKLRGKKSAGEELSGPIKTHCAIAAGDISSLDSVGSGAGEVSSILVAYVDGRLLSVKNDLSATREARLPFPGQSVRQVEYSAEAEAESARKGILKGRADVLAALEENGTGGLRGIMIVQVLRAGSSRRFELSLLQQPAEHGLQGRSAGVQSVVSFDLPRSSATSGGLCHHEVHASSGKLFSLLYGRLVVYDVASLVPKVLVDLGSADAPIASFIRLSASMLVAISSSTASIYETTYGSLQAVGKLHIASAAPASTTKKRKRESMDGEEMQHHPGAVSALSELGVFVYLSGTQLAAVQLGDEVLSHIKGKERPPLLSDVLGRGLPAEVRERSKDAEQDNDTKSSWETEVDNLIEANDVEGLEALVANDQALGRQRKPEQPMGHDSTGKGNGDGDATAYDDLWPLPEPLDPTKLNRQRILYLVSKIFSYAPDEDQVEVRIASRKLLEWLALAGNLDRGSLEKALRADGTAIQRETVQAGDIMTAIAVIDEEFQLMHSLLSLPAQWDLPEVVQAMCLLIRSFDASDTAERADSKLALLGIPTTTGDAANANAGDIAMVNGDADSNIESESKAAQTELEHVERVLMSGLEVRSDTLRVILERLHAFPARNVTQTMRTMMTQKELIFLIHMLRIELADGGWTSRYTGAGADEERYESSTDPLLASMVDVIPGDGETGPSNRAIRAIGDLLNCAIDAVGTSGWLVGLSGDTMGTEELLDSLRAEVSAGLEGCYEADTLGTFLAELNSFVATKSRPRDGRAEEVEPMLPVGGRADVSRRRGKKSKQLVALERSKKVGKYSIDRIRF